MKTFIILTLVAAVFLGLAVDASPLLDKRASCVTYIVDCESHHLVAKGETCEIIAGYYNYSVSYLLELNPGLDCNNLPVGQYICHKARSIKTTTTSKCSTTAPSTTTTTTAPTTHTTTTTTSTSSCVPKISESGSCEGHHTLVKTDTCASLEATYGLDMAHLLALNPGLNCSNLLAYGTRICHKGHFTTQGGCASTTTTPPPTTTSSAPTTVPSGDVVAVVVDVNNFCFFLPPPNSNKNIADNEDDAVAFCTTPQSAAPKALMFPSGFFTYKYFATGTNQGTYIQVTGQIDITKYGLSSKDGGGQYDSEGSPPDAVCSGYPHFVNLIEPDAHRFCIRCCSVRSDCNFGHSTKGCPYVVPGNYGPGGDTVVNHPIIANNDVNHKHHNHTRTRTHTHTHTHTHKL